jgi:ATP-binding cassette, subfamily B, bacterial
MAGTGPALASDASARPKAALSSLRPIVPFALAYRGRIALALLALAAASAATLVVPIAVRRVVDHGFSEGSGELIDAYFGVLVLVVSVLAVSSALRTSATTRSPMVITR